jgi:hypothetical protein
LKLESKQGFLSIRANNCVVKGKWVYEVELITNKLSQIGWCQLITTFDTHNGIGDDRTSYAYDGYRVTLWHGEHTGYGELWDIGDIIGIAIDLDARQIEYFRNGKSLGIALTDIPIGQNIAYFPGISLSSGERVIFNFGKSPFSYSYLGYEPIDIADCMYNGSVEITAECISILKTFLLKVLLDVTITQFHKLSLSNKIFSFLISVSFKDSFIFKTLILPFLYELSPNKELFKVFIDYVYIYLEENEKNEMTNLIFEELCNYIEENSLKGAVNISEWQNLIQIFLAFLKIDYLVQYWIDGNKYIENLKAVFNSNLIKNFDLFKYVKENYNNFDTEICTNKALKQMIKSLQLKIEQENEKYENIYSQNLIKVIEIFLMDKRSFKKPNKQIQLNIIIADFINQGFEFGHPNDFQNLFAINYAKRDYNFFYKNFIMNLYQVLNKNLNIEDFSPDLWFTRMSNDNIYYDEVGIGGTISHATTEYINTIDEKYRVKGVEFYSDLNHRVIKLSYAVLLPAIKDYCNILDKVSLKLILV